MPTYTGIKGEVFRHPLDRQAEETLRSLPGFELLTSTFLEYLYERPQQVFLLGNNLRAGNRQYSTLYRILRECSRDLDLSPTPALYVNQSPQINSYALGYENPYIVINTGLLELLNEIEIRTVLAHELGHIKCNHTLLIQMAIWVMGAASILGELTLGLGDLISTGLIFSFYEWRRKAELSADRAALLVVDDLNRVLETMMKLAGGSKKYLHECSLEEFIAQANDYQQLDENSLNSLYKFLIYNGGTGSFLTHPFPVERLHYLKAWSSSDEYRQIRSGKYPRAETKGAIDVSVTRNDKNDREVEKLQLQVKDLQAEINRIKSQKNLDNENDW